MSITSLNIGTAENLKSVSARIGDAVIQYVESKLNEKFTAAELRRFVAFKVGPVAPGSPDRILRNLRQNGVVNYELVNRAKSLYRALPVYTAVFQGDGDGTAQGATQ